MIDAAITLSSAGAHPIGRCVRLAALAALALCLTLPCPAFAEVRASDLILGEAADAQGLDANALPDISAPYAAVMGADGTFYYERDADTQVKIASVTKIMTAIVALDSAEADTVITVDETAAGMPGAESGLEAGDTMTLENALIGLLIPSGNDAAVAIGTSVGALIDPSSADSLQTFVDAMNAKAAELGLADTFFENPHGLDNYLWEGDHHSTARDVAKMAHAAMENELIRSIVGGGDADMVVTGADGTERTVHLEDVNALIGQNGNIGVKTGETRAAGLCFAGAWERDGEEFYTVVLGCADREVRFQDSLGLADWYDAHTVPVPAVVTDRETAGGDPLVAQIAATAWTDKSVDVTVAEDERTVEAFDLAGEIGYEIELDEVAGGVSEGDSVGSVVVTQDGDAIAEVDLVAAENVPEPSPVEWVMVQFDRLVRMVSGQPQHAETVCYAKESAA